MIQYVVSTYVQGKHMKYFWTEEERRKRNTTLCFEFQKGKYRGGRCWLPDSLCLHADIFDRAGLYALFREAMPSFDYYYSQNYVTKETWQTILELAHQSGGEKEAIMLELVPFVQNCFKTEEAFTISGI